MADSFTPILNLTLPEVGASRDTWGTKVNQNFSTIDSYLGYGVPIGMVGDFAAAIPPKGWLVADGRLISRVTYAALFAVVGTLFGAGDGSSTFALPNLNGRSTIGPGSVTDQASVTTTFTFAQISGYVSNTITQANIPVYTLTSSVIAAHNHGGATQPGGNHSHTMDVQGYHAHGGSTSNPGDHTHTGYTDVQGAHSHNVYSGQMGNGQAGPYGNVPFGSLGLNGYYTDVQGSHQHNIQTYGAGNHTHSISTDGQGSHAHNIAASGNLQLAISLDGSHSHTIASGGSGTAMTVLNPILVMTKMIFAGPQAFVTLGTQAAPLTIDAEEWTDIDALRAEIQELKDMLASIVPRRLISSPLRGPN